VLLRKKFGAGAGTHDAERTGRLEAGTNATLTMEEEVMKRQAATSKGLKRRLRDLGLDQVPEPRVSAKVRYSLELMLTALVVGMVTGARSLRKVEQRTGQIADNHEAGLGIPRRIADNTFGKVVPRIAASDLLGRLHALVKAEHRRGNLKPTVLPVGVAAIDGKNVATLRWRTLCRVLRLNSRNARPQQVKALLSQRFPNVQFCIPKQGEPYALARVHTVTLISSAAAVCIHQRPIPGATNEIGAMPNLMKELHDVYGRLHLFEIVTTDAGNTSLDTAGQIDRYGLGYFCQIKSEHGDLYTEAEAALGAKTARTAQKSESDSQNGQVVTYRVWRYDLTEAGWLNWTHARQLVRVQRIAENPLTGEKSEGNRYYVTNRAPGTLGSAGCLKLSRGHWRCEDETHWTTDVVFHEDRRRLAWSRHPAGVFVVSALRMIALSILAVARRLSRIGYSEETPTWEQVTEHFVVVLCSPILVTVNFDAVP
jgi:hypothetical protein